MTDAIPRSRVPDPPFESAVVLGGGLLGASIALALRARAAADRVVVADPDPDARQLLAQRGLQTTDRLPSGESPGLVVLAAPPAANLEILPDATDAYPEAVFTDVTSVKRPILELAARLRERNPAHLRFVGSHPIAGGTTSGPTVARDDLFAGRVVVLCSLPDTPPPVFQSVERTWRLLGAVPVEMPAEDHDVLLAATSHLPQVVASLLAAHVATRVPAGAPGELLVGPGLADTTRLAASSPALWQEILEANQENVRREVAALADRLHAWAETKPAGWRDELEAGREARRRWENR